MAFAKKTTPVFGYIVTPYVSVKMITNISATSHAILSNPSLPLLFLAA